MLPRVSAALSQFIAPVASSTQKNVERQKPEASFKRFEDSNQGKKEESTAQPQDQPKETLPPNVLPFPKASVPVESGKGQPASKTVTVAFLQLVALLQNQRAVLVRLFGRQTYGAIQQKQKRFGRLKKGVMLDHKAE